jgi:hypothetical protein
MSSNSLQMVSPSSTRRAAALKLGFFSRDNSTALQINVLESTLPPLHTELHPNSLIAFMITLNEILRLRVSILDAGLRPDNVSTIQCESDLHDNRLPFLRALCPVLLPQASQYRLWYCLGANIGDCRERQGLDSCDVDSLCATILQIDADLLRQLRTLTRFRDLASGHSGSLTLFDDAIRPAEPAEPRECYFTETDDVVGRFFDLVLHEVKTALPTRGEERQELMRQRGEYCWQQLWAGRTKREIRDALPREFLALTEGVLEEDTVRRLANEHADDNGLPRPPRGRSGRPRRSPP